MKHLNIDQIVGICTDYTTKLTEEILAKPIPQEKPLIIERPQLNILENLPLMVGVLYGDWGQGKSTIGMAMYHRATQIRSLHVTYVSLNRLSLKLREEADLEQREIMKRFYEEIGINPREAFSSIPEIPYMKILQFLAPLITNPSLMIEIYGEDIGILSNLPIMELPTELYKGDPVYLLDTLSRKLDKRYLILLDELEAVPGFRFQYYRTALGRFLLDLRRLFDLWNRIPKITIVFFIPTFYRTDFDAIIRGIRLDSLLARAGGILQPEIQVSKLNNEELRRYIQSIEKYVLKYQAISDEALDLIVNLASKMETSRLAVYFARGLYWNSIKEALKKNKIYSISIPSSEPKVIIACLKRILETQKIRASMDDVKEVMGLTTEFFSIYEGKYREVSRKAQRLLEAISYNLINYLRNHIGSDYDISNSEALSNAPGFVSRAFVVSSKRTRVQKYIVIWLRLSPIRMGKLKIDTLVRKLGFPIPAKTGRRAEPLFEEQKIQIFCLHPNDIRVPGLLTVAPNHIRTISLTHDELIACLMKAGIIYIPFLAESLNRMFDEGLIPRISQEIQNVLTR